MHTLNIGNIGNDIANKLEKSLVDQYSYTLSNNKSNLVNILLFPKNGWMDAKVNPAIFQSTHVLMIQCSDTVKRCFNEKL